MGKTTRVSRRTFLKAAMATGGVAALGGLVGCSSSADDAEPEAGTATDASTTDTGDAEWKTAPASVADSEISAEYDADFVIVGAGHAGTNCARVLVEADASVILIEKQAEADYAVLGNEWGHINSDMNRNLGVPDADPIEFYNNWMIVTKNLAQPDLVMQFAQRGGEAMDAFCSIYTEEQKGNFSVYFWDDGPYPNAIDEIGGQKFWYGCLTLRGTNSNMTMTDAYNLQHQYITENGGSIYYAMDAAQLIQADDGTVTGIIATDADGNYAKFNAAKAVALTAGDFSGNETMRSDLLPQLSGILIPGESLGTMGGRTGRGIELGYWAGGKLEAPPIATLGGDYVNPSGLLGNGGVPIWLDENGKRYCNEFFGGPEIAGRTGARSKHTMKYCVYDTNCTEYLSYGLPCHTSFDYTDKDALANVETQMGAAIAAGAEGAEGVYAADDFETLAGYLGLTDDVVTNFVESCEHYNEMCETGTDSDYGRDSRVLWKLEPPYIAQATSMFMVGMMMVSHGGLITDGNSNVLDENYEQIPNLYAAGNNCGRRFGDAYFTPIAGVSCGFATVQGYVLGDYLSKL